MSGFLFNAFHAARQYLTPPLTVSQFYEQGKLTPDEFVAAGDQLIKMAPVWRWSRGSTTHLKPYLPPAKQFLVLNGAVSRCRVNDISGSDLDMDAATATTAALPLPASPDFSPSRPPAVGGAGADPAAAEDDEYADMRSFCDPSLICHDTGAVGPSSAESERLYEITITYDNAYQTPRVYLRGQKVSGERLNAYAMMEDVMQDYVSKTATLEAHPHSGEQYLSIHPCRHAQTMKRLVDQMVENGSVPPVELYLFIFLKFINSMIPTIDYDNTLSVRF